MKIPQLRILATSFCERGCLYCRPTGEGDLACGTKKFIDLDKAVEICRLYKEKGGTEVKITGGDPVFWPELVNFVKQLKSDLGFQKVEVITRSPEILEKAVSLAEAGMDVLNFSLDTVDKETYEKITGSRDCDELIAAIRECAKMVPVKINAVIMKGVNDLNVKELVAFCEEAGVQQLKLLDVIKDLQGREGGNLRRLGENGIRELGELYVPLTSISEEIKRKAESEEIVYQGGLGHPMNEFQMPSGLVITVKDSENGAWYGKICETCASAPCHDALMAIRLTPDNRIQFCLLNEEAAIPLDGVAKEGVERVFSDALKVYEEAHFVKRER